MNAESMIDALALDFGPVRSAGLQPRPIFLGVTLASAAVILFWGIRPGGVEAFESTAIWIRCGYTLGLAAGALWLGLCLARPGAGHRAALAAVLVPLVALAAAATVGLAAEPPSQWLHDVLGRSWMTCSASIALLSMLTAPLVVLSARRLAPVRPDLAGAALGVAAGALAATAYGLLHCAESSPVFILLWYTLGMAPAAAMGAAFGRKWLRW